MSFELPPPTESIQATLRQLSTPACQPAGEQYVRFYTRSKRDPIKSAEAGRPIFEPAEYVEIFCAGDKDNVVDRPVRPHDPYVWPTKYKAFRDSKDQTCGTLLSAWGGVPPERVREYEHFRVTTVEQLAEVSDASLQNLGIHARAERTKAQAYLAVMAGKAPIDELKNENEQLKARLEALEKLANQTKHNK